MDKNRTLKTSEFCVAKIENMSLRSISDYNDKNEFIYY